MMHDGDSSHPRLRRRTEPPDEIADRLILEFVDWLKREKIPIHGWITALSSVALIAVTIGQLVVACGSSTQTDQMIAAANVNAEAAKKFSTAAEGIENGIDQTVGKLDIQAYQLKAGAGQTERLTNETEKANGNVTASERPWLAVVMHVSTYAKDSPTEAFFQIVNTGKRPAKIVEIRYGVKAYSNFPDTPYYRDDPQTSSAILVPGQSGGSSFSIAEYTASPWFEAVHGPNLELYVYGFVSYVDIQDGSAHYSRTCVKYVPKVKFGPDEGFYSCHGYNDAT